jgi:hypothetical protein
VPAIDGILKAIEDAGDGYHHTELWEVEGDDGEPSMSECIQEAADLAARAFRALGTEK